jgi:S1-C subfamily serine protease
MQKNLTLSIVLVAAIVGALVGGGFTYGVLAKALKTEVATQIASYQPSISNQDAVDGATAIPAASPGTADQDNPSVKRFGTEEQRVVDIYKNVSPAVVHVSTVAYYRTFFGVQPQEGTGSGFIISDDGYVLTNNHVVQGAQKITVRLLNGQEHTATLVGADELSDIAVLKLDNTKIDPKWVAKLGDSDTLQIGQIAIAIGNPFGLDSTVTVGVVSALNRPVTTDSATYDNMIQTDATINPGNSGGPLIDSSGKVIGVNAIILSKSGGSQGIGFAIPINQAKIISDDLIKYNHVRRPSLGFDGLTLMPNLASALGLSIDHGVLVQSVVSGSAAADAGLQGGRHQVTLRDAFRSYTFYSDGDVIVKFNGEKVEEISRLSDQIRKQAIGAQVTLTVVRNGQEMDLHLTLKE